MASIGDIDPQLTLEPTRTGRYACRVIDRNTYDVDCDQGGYFSNSPSGYGLTPLEAIVDLLDQMESRP